MATPTTSDRSAFGVVKENSRQLRGDLAADLASEADHISADSAGLLKFHGSYQQVDRDARKLRSKDGVTKHHMFMVRCKIPGGKLTAEQYLGVDALAGQFANGTLRVTSRQGLQLHGVLKGDLKATIRGINETLLTTLGACGDVNRNVMACPAPFADPVRAEMQRWADRIAAAFAPRTTAYHDVWLDGEHVGEPNDVEEPIYGKTYLPRKFKVGFGLPHDNCVDVFAHDLAFLVGIANGRVAGYDMLVGGGMGMTHGNANTFPHLARPMCWIEPDQVLSAAEAVIKLFRDHGNRVDRKRARLKYLVHTLGTDGFRELLAKYLPFPLVLPRGLTVVAADLHLGWHPQSSNKWFYGLSIENGRIKDDGGLQLRTGLRAIIDRFKPTIRFTPQQDILFCNLDATIKDDLEEMLDSYGIRPAHRIGATRQLSLACPAIPTCGLAISESERALPGVIDQFESELEVLGLGREAVSIRMTGCPNGCVRPYQSDIGLVGRSGIKYTLFVGGNSRGDRLNFELRDLVPLPEIVTTLRPLLHAFAAERTSGESFGDYCHRVGVTRLRELAGCHPD